VSEDCWKIVPLERGQDCSAFDCGEPELNDWLRLHALPSGRSGSARTFVAVDGANRVLAYYAIAAQSVVAEEAPGRLKKGMPRHPVPVVLLARLAVDHNFQGRGLGAGLLKNALLRTLNASRDVGIRAIIVDAKQDAARRFYEHFDFEAFPGNPARLFLLIKDLRKSL
jgi:GNAT superfamily N-acetyltransferase